MLRQAAGRPERYGSDERDCPSPASGAGVIPLPLMHTADTCCYAARVPTRVSNGVDIRLGFRLPKPLSGSPCLKGPESP